MTDDRSLLAGIDAAYQSLQPPRGTMNAFSGLDPLAPSTRRPAPAPPVHQVAVVNPTILPSVAAIWTILGWTFLMLFLGWFFVRMELAGGIPVQFTGTITVKPVR